MRVVSLAPSNTEILYRIDAEDQVVATTSLCDYPEEAADKPSIGGWTNPRISDLEKHDPDLVLASDDLQDEAVEKVEEAGYEVLQVKPHTMEEVYGSIEKIGRKVGKEEVAAEVVDEMRRELEEIDIGGARIYCEEWMDPPMVSGNWIPGMIEEIGGEYFIRNGRSRKFELQELKEFDPEYIFLNVCGAGENLAPDPVLERDEWQEITALEKGNVFVVDDSLFNRPGPRLVEAAKKIEEKIA